MTAIEVRGDIGAVWLLIPDAWDVFVYRDTRYVRTGATFIAVDDTVHVRARK